MRNVKGGAKGWVVARGMGGACKTMLCFIAEKLTDASGAVSPLG